MIKPLREIIKEFNPVIAKKIKNVKSLNEAVKKNIITERQADFLVHDINQKYHVGKVV